MIKNSIKSLEEVEISDKELVRLGPSFTIDTLQEFISDYGDTTRFFLLMGSDAFLDITTWKNMDALFDLAQIIIMLRGKWPNFDQLTSFIDENISKGYNLRERNHVFYHKTKQNITICKVPRIDISSTLIRHRIKQNRPIKDLVPESVEQIIRTKELYQ